MIEFDINNRQYRAERLDAFQQLHVSRKVAPLIPTLIPAFLKVQQMPGKLKDNIGAIAGTLQPFADGIAGLSDESLEYVVSTCLSVVRRRQGDNWAPIWSTKANAVMFDDISDIGSLIPIIVRVIQDSLGPFIFGLLTSQQTTEAAAAASPGEPSQAEKTGS